ncbi:MAG TPA: response regulator [Gemmatimonadaceae bacterium]|nr:response regulator [Gemmatimonadaceae bacterium]
MSSESVKHVLVVEDEQSIRDILVELFDVEGNALVAVETLNEALESLRTKPYDLIVTDLRLGGKRDGGLQVMAMAGMVSYNATVIVLTAYPDDANRQAANRLGALHFLEKPVDLHTIASLASEAGVGTAFGESTSGSSELSVAR